MKTKSKVNDKLSMNKIVVLGADHNGVELKELIKKNLTRKGYFCVDVGPYDKDSKVDYVDYALTIAKIISNKEANYGVLICGTGVGMSMAANRFPKVRASLVHNLKTAGKTREHNDANVLCLGAWINPHSVNLKIVEKWFGEKFGEGRHVPRVEKLSRDSKAEKIVFTNGVFDVVHPGHIKLLKFAKSLGGKLIIGINSDRAVKILKGKDRPINSEDTRKVILESLNFVDQVVIFDDVNTKNIINKLKPNILVKGGEWTAEQVRKKDEIPSEIEIKICPLLADISTTNFIKRVQGKK